MRPFVRLATIALSAAALPVHGTGLPDTGQDTCYDNGVADTVPPASSASIARDGAGFSRQDCRYGADPAAAVAVQIKIGGGGKGFDYTKIANDGSVLPAGAAQGTAAADWACTRDNVTGLTWEVKTPTGTDLRSIANTYAWFDTNSGNNGGNVGSTGSNTCNGTLPAGLCNTQAYVAAVNTAALCTYTDWRMPTRRELFTLIRDDGSTYRIDPDYFPNSNTNQPFWSASSNAQDATTAWDVNFYGPGAGVVYSAKTAIGAVRLVRGGSF